MSDCCMVWILNGISNLVKKIVFWMFSFSNTPIIKASVWNFDWTFTIWFSSHYLKTRLKMSLNGTYFWWSYSYKSHGKSSHLKMRLLKVQFLDESRSWKSSILILTVVKNLNMIDLTKFIYYHIFFKVK